MQPYSHIPPAFNNSTPSDNDVKVVHQYMASPIQAVVSFFENYANFRGRSSRSEYWWVVLFIFVLNLAITILTVTTQSVWMSIISFFVSLILIVPNLSLISRRMHDIGLGAQMYFIPILGMVLLWIFTFIMTMLFLFYYDISFYDDYISYTQPSNIEVYAVAMLCFITLFVSLALPIVYLILFMRPSEPNTNRFGNIPNAW